MGNCLSANKNGGVDSNGVTLDTTANHPGGVSNSAAILSGIQSDHPGVTADALAHNSNNSHHHNHPVHHVRNNPNSLPPLPDSESNAQVCFCFFVFCLPFICILYLTIHF